MRKPGAIDDLARRRGRMNPRLSHEWLRYLVSVGARQDPDGWRWKIDPALRFGGFGPWRHSWTLGTLSSVSAPLLGILGLEPEDMGWGTQRGQLEPYLPSSARLEYFEDAGHFVHIEKPREVADLVLDFLR
jgi:pimeloyl-ACP methyl ester carboxylesterase